VSLTSKSRDIGPTGKCFVGLIGQYRFSRSRFFGVYRHNSLLQKSRVNRISIPYCCNYVLASPDRSLFVIQLVTDEAYALTESQLLEVKNVQDKGVSRILRSDCSCPACYAAPEELSCHHNEIIIRQKYIDLNRSNPKWTAKSVLDVFNGRTLELKQQNVYLDPYETLLAYHADSGRFVTTTLNDTAYGGEREYREVRIRTPDGSVLHRFDSYVQSWRQCMLGAHLLFMYQRDIHRRVYEVFGLDLRSNAIFFRYPFDDYVDQLIPHQERSILVVRCGKDVWVFK